VIYRKFATNTKPFTTNLLQQCINDCFFLNRKNGKK